MTVVEQTVKCPACEEPHGFTSRFCNVCGTHLKHISDSINIMIGDLRRRLMVQPEDTDIHYNLAIAYLETGNYDLAESELRTVVEMEPWFADAQVRLAGIYMRKGQRDKAIKRVQKALDAEPGNFSAKRLAEQLQLVC